MNHFEGMHDHIISPVDTVLDIGCGTRPQQLVACNRHIYIDPHGESIDYLKREEDPPGLPEPFSPEPRRIDPKNFGKFTWAQALTRYAPVDTVTLLNVIEHVEKKDALKWLERTKTICKQILIYTPEGFIEQNDPNCIWQNHRSGWTLEDFGDGWVTGICYGVHNAIFVDGKWHQVQPYNAIWGVWTCPS